VPNARCELEPKEGGRLVEKCSVFAGRQKVFCNWRFQSQRSPQRNAKSLIYLPSFGGGDDFRNVGASEVEAMLRGALTRRGEPGLASEAKMNAVVARKRALDAQRELERSATRSNTSKVSASGLKGFQFEFISN
jgi:hypothetical protein